MIITIARQAGSRGHDVAAQAAARLDLPLIGREQIDRCAAAVGVGRQPLDDERAALLARRIADLLVGGQDLRGRLTPPAENFPTTRDASYRALVERVLRRTAETTSAIVLGNAAQHVLAARPDCLHVFVTAPLALRIRCVAMREDLELSTAEHVVHESDRERAEYIRRFYQSRWDDPMVYDLVLNTAQLSDDQAAQAIVAAASARAL